MPLRLVHLSDIHFQGYGHAAGWDEDADQRAELIRDLKLVVGSDPVDGIMVGGDIAFSAEPGEYATARAWLDDVVTTCGVDRSRVWVVPGNHDVSRSVISHSPAAQDFRWAVRECAADGIDKQLRDRLSGDPAAEGAMMAFENYNAFAGDFGCGTTAQQPHWFDGATLSCDGHSVKITGINSALVSDSSDGKNEDVQKLVVGTWQCKLARQDGLIQLAISHHPPQWIRDWERVEPYLRRAHVVLFGHEHCFAAEQKERGKTVYIYAGAVGPERLGDSPNDEYLPSWGLITISPGGESLHVSVEPRVWQRKDTCFGEHPDGLREFDVDVDLKEPSRHEVPDSDEDATVGIDASPLTSSISAEMRGEATGIASQRRKLGIRFMTLPPSRRLEIARVLGVLDEPTDLDLPKPKLYETILTRIRERSLIERLQEELDRGQ